MRQIVLDTETTGLSPKEHRIIEIGAVVLQDRCLTEEQFHHYIFPDRSIDAGAERVHGISLSFLRNKPQFEVIVDAFLTFVSGAELIIHNAPFDVGFLNAELARLDRGNLSDHCTVLDTLKLARAQHPGQRNTLDALCKRYKIDSEHRIKHGALLDAQILAEVYLAMTGGQEVMDFGAQKKERHAAAGQRAQAMVLHEVWVQEATPEEEAAHAAYWDGA